MPKLATLVKVLKQYALYPKLSDEEFLNAFLSSYIVAGRINNKNGEELYLDKAQTSLLINQKIDVNQNLRKALAQYEIREKTEDGMIDFIADYINPHRIQKLVEHLLNMIKADASNYENEKDDLSAWTEVDVSKLLTELLFRSLTECNKEEIKNSVLWKCGSNMAEVIIGDLFDYGFDRSNNGRKNILVIPVNSAFDTHVSQKIESNSKPIVSENTIHGQWIQRLKERKIDIDEIDYRIRESLQAHGHKQVGVSLDKNGKSIFYGIGACAVIEIENTVFFLTAISNFDKNNIAKSTPEMIRQAFISILKSYNKIGQGYTLYFPLMGTGRSRAGLSMKDSYALLKQCIINNTNLIQGRICLVVRPEDREEII